MELKEIRSRLSDAAAEDQLTPKELEEGFRTTGILPGRKEWRAFADASLLFLGLAFLLAGIIFFFAFNWAELHKFTKLGSIALLLIAASIIAVHPGPDTLAGKGAVTAAAVLTGVFLAVYGQIYQTGADTWELFMGWALLVTPWVLAARFLPLRMIYMVLLNTWAFLFMHLYFGRGPLCCEVPALINAAALVIFEALTRLKAPGRETRWFSGVLVAALQGFLVSPVSQYIFSAERALEEDLFPGFAVLLYLAVSAALVAWNILKTRDLFPVAVTLFSTVIYSVAIQVKLFDQGLFSRDPGGWFIMGLITITHTSLLVFLLRIIHARLIREAGNEG